MKRLNINASIESFLVMVLMIVFTISTALIIVEGKQAFERVIENKEEDEEARIALSYVNKRIKQNDFLGNIEVIENGVEGRQALRIAHDYEDGLYTYIFYDAGMLYECYTDMVPTINLSTEIIPVKGVSFNQEGSLITMTVDYEYLGKYLKLNQVISLRTGGSDEK
jgi:hypothetical protein